MPHAGHFICGQWCRFRLNTWVGKYIVSTVGEYLPDAGVREVFAECRKVKLEGKGDARLADYMKKIGYEELHYGGYLYETMVFRAVKAPEGDKDACCPYRQDSGENVDSDTYKTAAEAYLGHQRLCEKWSKE